MHNHNKNKILKQNNGLTNPILGKLNIVKITLIVTSDVDSLSSWLQDG